MMMLFQTINFFNATPLRIGIGLAIFAAVVLVRMVMNYREHTMVRFLWSAMMHYQQGPVYLQITKVYARTFLISIGFLAALVALSRPQWGQTDEIIMQDGRDVVVALDISRSMLATDFLPTRLEFAKFKLKTLLRRLARERVGLVLFSGTAFVQVPLTSDYQAFEMFLDHVDVEMIASGTTALDKALLKALEVHDAQTLSESKIILLVTDGEDFSTHIEHAQKKAAELGVKIIAYGVATPEGAPIPRKDHQGVIRGYEQDLQGQPILSKLNQPLLEKITSALGGIFIQATASDEDIQKMADYLEGCSATGFEEKKTVNFEERYPWFVGIALVCSAIRALL